MKPPARRSRGPGTPPALLAAALRALGDGVVVSRLALDPPRLRVVFANDLFLAMTGRRWADLAGQPHAALHTEHTDLDRVFAWGGGEDGARPLTGEGYLASASGEPVHVAWSFNPLRDRAGRITHLVASYRDTTEKRRLQEALVHAQRLDAVGRLAGGVAHDFNNLLSIINGYCEILAVQVSDRAAVLREVQEIHRAGRRAAALTHQLLAFGRRTPMDPRVVNLNRLIRDHAEIMQRLIGPAGRLELELAPGLPNVRTDPTQFQQVLLNLVLNARDALRDQGRITITTLAREVKAGHNRRASDAPPGRYVCLAVTDNGTGMDAETQKHLFEPFFTTKPEGKGTGLGLALVYGVVQQSAGFVNVRTAVLAGSTFEVLLPEVNEPEDAGADSPTTSPLPASAGHETLLLVEADVVVGKMMAGVMTATGYRVLSARSPEQAAALASQSEFPVQLALLPVGKAGEGLARKLAGSSPHLRLLWIGNDTVPAVVGWLPVDRQSTLSKPFALSEVLRSIRTLLDQRDTG